MDDSSISQKLERVSGLILEGRRDLAKEELRKTQPGKLRKIERKSYGRNDALKIFARDGFIDRYSGKQLVFPGILLLFSKLYPAEFPYNRNWRMDSTHFAYWELSPTLDHVMPLARGGENVKSNLVTTSMLRNQAKANWTLEELGWELLPQGDLSAWDGLMNRFFELVETDESVLQDPKIRMWHSAAAELL